jgi:polysaccharide export outer membrane protein
LITGVAYACRGRKWLAVSVAGLVLSSAVGGCAFLPGSGPLVPIAAQDPQSILPHVLVNVSHDVAVIASKWVINTSDLGSFRGKPAAPEMRLGVGDIVTVAIFEAASGGLFIPSDAGARAGNFVQLPDQQIDKAGNIAVPYAGAVKAAGRRPAEIQATIEERLRNRAIEPQAVVTLKTQLATQVSVLGDVHLPVRIPVNQAGIKLLDAIAQAGGPSGEGWETFVTLQRGGKQKTIFFNRLVEDPSNNIFVQASDIIYVQIKHSAFTILGAVTLPGKYNFEAAQITVGEALGRGNGLIDIQANPSGIYLYRHEDRQTAQALGIDVSAWSGPTVPIIYNFNGLNAETPFILRTFQVRDQDIIYVANAPGAELAKFLGLAKLGADAANSAYNLKIPR